MKKTLMLLLVNVSLYGNTPVKENILKKIIYFLCPCAKKNVSKVYKFKPIHRVDGNEELNYMDNTPTEKGRDGSVFEDGELLKIYESNPITDKHRAQWKAFLEQRDRNLLKVPVETIKVQ